ncbi:MAG: PAS domain-containing protein [Gammaproteobacteria bacterium]
MFVLGFVGGQLLSRAMTTNRWPRFARSHSRDIIHHASEAIITTDEAYTIVLANTSAAAMFATTIDAMQGTPLARYISPRPAPAKPAWPCLATAPAAPAGAPPTTPSPACAPMA